MGLIVYGAGDDPVKDRKARIESCTRMEEEICEVCGGPLGKKIWIELHVYGPDANGAVLIACDKCEPPGCYDIPLSRFYGEDPGMWLAHLSEKVWATQELALNIMWAMRRLRSLAYKRRVGSIQKLAER